MTGIFTAHPRITTAFVGLLALVGSFLFSGALIEAVPWLVRQSGYVIALVFGTAFLFSMGLAIGAVFCLVSALFWGEDVEGAKEETFTSEVVWKAVADELFAMGLDHEHIDRATARVMDRARNAK